MAVLVDVNYTKSPAKLDALQEAARAHNVEFSIHRVAKDEEIAAAINSAQASGATALNILSSPLFYAHQHLIIERTAAARLPTIYDFPETAEEGGFAAYGPRDHALVLVRDVTQLAWQRVHDVKVRHRQEFRFAFSQPLA